jgi:hypothetical protein
MARFKPGQSVRYNGQHGVVEAVDLTPGMLDVRYGQLVKRHVAADVTPTARANPRQRRPQRKDRTYTRAWDRNSPVRRNPPVRRNTGDDEAYKTKRAEYAAATAAQAEAASALTLAERTHKDAQDEAVRAERKKTRSVKARTDLSAYLTWKKLYDKALTEPPVPQRLQAAVLKLRKIEKRQGPLQRRDAEQFFRREGVLDQHVLWGAMRNAAQVAPEMIALRAGLSKRLRVPASTPLSELKKIAEARAAGAENAFTSAAEAAKTALTQKKAATTAEKSAAAWKAGSKPSKRKKPKRELTPDELVVREAEEAKEARAAHKTKVAGDKIERARRGEEVERAGQTWEGRRTRERYTPEPGTTEHQARGGGEAAVLLSADTAEMERGADAHFFVLPDPPRFEKSWKAPNQYFQELCGNPVDGSMYVLRLSGKVVSTPRLITTGEWKKLKREWTSRGKDNVWPEPGAYEEVTALLTRLLKGQGYTVSARGRRREDQPDATQPKKLVFFTADDVHRMNIGDVIEAVPTRGRAGTYDSPEMGLDLRSRLAYLEQQYAHGQQNSGRSAAARLQAEQNARRLDAIQGGLTALQASEAGRKVLSAWAVNSPLPMDSAANFAAAIMQVTQTQDLNQAVGAVQQAVQRCGLREQAQEHRAEFAEARLPLLPAYVYAQLSEAKGNDAAFAAIAQRYTRREKALLASLKGQLAEVKEKVDAADAGKSTRGVEIRHALSSATPRQRRAKKGWGGRTIDATGRSAAASKSASEKMFSEYQLPKNTFFYEVPGQGYLAFTAWKRVPVTLERLSERFTPPFSSTSNKTRDPFFTWQPLRRSLATTDPFVSPPRCATSQHSRVLEIARDLRSPLYTMGDNLRWLWGLIQSGGGDKPLKSLIRAGDTSLRTAAWFANWMQDAHTTLSRVPKSLENQVPERRVLAAIQKSKKEPQGLPLDTLIRAAATGPVPLVTQVAGSAARVIGGVPLVGKVKGIALNLPQRFAWKPFAEGHFSWDRLQADARKAREDGNTKLLAQVEARQANTFVGEVTHALLAFNLKTKDGPTALAALIATKQVQSGMIQEADVSAVVAHLKGVIRRLPLFESGPDADELRRRQDRTRDPNQRLTPEEISSAQESDRRHKILRALFVVYQVMGGTRTQLRLSAAQKTLGMLAENAGRLPPEGHTGQQLTLLEAKAELDDHDLQRDAERYARGAKKLKEAQAAVHEAQYGKAVAKHLNKGDKLYYTFNPVLFQLTRSWWSYGTPWARRGGTLSKEAVRHLQEVDRVGRYGVALRLMYEAAKDGDSEIVVRDRLREELGEDQFFDPIYAKLRDLDYDSDLADQYREIAFDENERLSSPIDGAPNLERLTPWTGGNPLLRQLPGGENGGWLLGLSDALDSGEGPESLQTATSGFAADPRAYLSELRHGAKRALMTSTRAAHTLRQREENRVKRAQAAQDEINATLDKRAQPPQVEARSTEPLLPLPAPVRAPYSREKRWSAGTRPTRFPRDSALAALEHVDRDSEKLRDLIEHRLGQLTRVSSSRTRRK